MWDAPQCMQGELCILLLELNTGAWASVKLRTPGLGKMWVWFWMLDVSKVIWSGCWVRGIVTGRTEFVVDDESLRERPWRWLWVSGKWQTIAQGAKLTRVENRWELQESPMLFQWRTQRGTIATMGIMEIMMTQVWVAPSPPGGRAWCSGATLSQKLHGVEPTMIISATKGREREKRTTSNWLVFDPMVPWP